MKVLFIGDSITAGKPGVSFVDLLREDLSGWDIVNAGVGGDTLKNIADRLIDLLKQDPHFDHIVIEAGYNDIILPSFKTRSIFFKLVLRHLLKVGRAPLTDVALFKNEYQRMLANARSLTKANIIITTIGCINEDPLALTDSTRHKCNEVIREVATANNGDLADVSKEFDKILSKGDRTNYLLNNFINSAYLDGNLYKTPASANQLSARRKLLLTIDGAHLNSKGANIFRQQILKYLSAPTDQ